MLGITNPDSDAKVLFMALATFLVVFSVNFLYELTELLPAMPTEQELYASFIRSLFTAVVIYITNKGIQWKHNSEGSKL